MTRCRRSSSPLSVSLTSSSGTESKWFEIAFLLRPMMMRMSSMPACAASSTTYWIAGLSTTGSISLGIALVAGRKRVPSPAAGMTALNGLWGMRATLPSGTCDASWRAAACRSRDAVVIAPRIDPCPTPIATREARPARRAARAPAAALADARGMPPPPASRDQLDALVDALGARSMSCFLSTTTEPGTREFVDARRARAASGSCCPSRAPTACSTGRSPRPTSTSPRACSACPSRSASCSARSP